MDSAKKLAACLAESVVDLAFPPRCIACGKPLASAPAKLCWSCWGIVAKEQSEAACPRCAGSIAPFEVRHGRCRQCRNRLLRIRASVRVAPDHGQVGYLIRQYKYAGREEIEPVLGEWLARAVMSAEWFKRVEAVVCVPTHWRHRLIRPLHAAQRLADFVARETNLPHVHLLRRTRAGKHQVQLPPRDRSRNVRGVFATRKGVRLENARLLLIDDVRTSGSTIEQCAKVLRHNGASEVFAAVVVKAD